MSLRVEVSDEPEEQGEEELESVAHVQGRGRLESGNRPQRRLQASRQMLTTA